LMRHLFTYGPIPVDEAERVPLKEAEIGAVPEHWEVAELGGAVTQAQYGLSTRGETHGAYPILRMNNLKNGRVDFESKQYVDLDEQALTKYRLRKGDLLFNRTNSYDLVGKTGLFDLDGDYVFASYLVRVASDDSRLIPEYANYYLNWAPTQARLKRMASRGVSQSNINASKLKSLLVPLPPLSAQQEVARTLSTVDEKIVAEENRKRTLEVLFKSLLHNLMTGKVRVKDRDLSEVEGVA
jgi:type I restriction enzyme S subunit